MIDGLTGVLVLWLASGEVTVDEVDLWECREMVTTVGRLADGVKDAAVDSGLDITDGDELAKKFSNTYLTANRVNAALCIEPPGAETN